MLSSTFSSERRTRHWVVTWSLAALLAIGMLASVEAYWRSRGYQPEILDSRQLWSIQRGLADQAGGRVLALLGASRTEYGISVRRLRQLLPGYTPVMLAVNAHYPIATLRDLAHEPNFDGVVLCDIDAMGFMRASWDGQQAYVDYYHTQWSPSWHVHRDILTLWQRLAVIANPAMGWKDSLRYVFVGGKPFDTYATYHSDRSGDIDFSKSDPAAIKRHFAELVKKRLKIFPHITPAAWLANVKPVAGWVRAIQSRGGEVIFYQSPTHGLERSALDSVLPQKLFWDRLPQVIPAHFMDAMQVPSLARIPEPDDSHVDYHDKVAYTDALIGEFIRRGWLRRLPPQGSADKSPAAKRN